MRAFLLSLCLAVLSPALQAFELSEPLKPFKAQYSASYNGRALSGSRELFVNDGQWQLKSQFKTLFAAIHESSEGSINDQLQLNVERYDYQRKIFGVKKRQSRIFNYDTSSLAFDDGKTKGSYTLPTDTFDTASQQLFIREMLMRGKTEFSMHMAARTNLKHLQFKTNAEAQLKLPMGSINAIRVDRIAASANSRQVSMWFSPSLDYQLVKLRQTEPNGKYYEMELTKVQ